MLSLSPEYKAFFWQFAHCFYPDAASMKKMIQMAGFKQFTFSYVQRYSIDNKQHWLTKKGPQIGDPSYTTKKADLKNTEVEYKRTLEKTGRADTFIVVVRS